MQKPRRRKYYVLPREEGGQFGSRPQNWASVFAELEAADVRAEGPLVVHGNIATGGRLATQDPCLGRERPIGPAHAAATLDSVAKLNHEAQLG